VAPSPPSADRVPLRWVARLFGLLMARYVRLVAATTRVSGPPVTQDQMILALWHESNLVATVAVVKLRNNMRFVSFTTRGFRGVVMDTLLSSLGAASIPLPDEGAAGRSEATSLSRRLARVGREGWNLVISCDGPWGPYRVAKPGVLIVARESGLPIQPWAISIRPAIRLRGRWDRQLVPLPFGALRVDAAEQIRIGARERIKPRLAELQSELDRTAEIAGRRMGRGRAARRSSGKG
jgi:lysophospholipid acyltransferase (LPLAT)-like uncharacterized protein